MQQPIEHSSSSPGAVEDELRFCPHCLDHQIRPSCFSCDGKKEKETFHSRKRPDSSADANSVCPLEPCKHEYSSKTSAIMLTLKMMKNERPLSLLCYAAAAAELQKAGSETCRTRSKKLTRRSEIVA